MENSSEVTESQRISAKIVRDHNADIGTQTVIRVYPHVLETPANYGRAISDKKSQTVILTRTNDINSDTFYALLRYTPFQDIRSDCQTVLNLPKKPKLAFQTHIAVGRADSANFSMIDDDGVGLIISEMLSRIRQGQNGRFNRFENAEVQTDLVVYPNVLDIDSEVTAQVLMTNQTQTQLPLQSRSHVCGRRNASI